MFRVLPWLKKSVSVAKQSIMRITNEQACFLKTAISKIMPDAKTYLFGSRADDKRKGGDIDILVIAEKQLTLQQVRDIRIAFCKKFGDQKLDIVSFRNDESSTFKELAQLDAVML